MAQLTPRQRRSEHRTRNGNMVDMNLVSLIDVFTILIFFLLSNSAAVETMPSSKAVRLPESTAQTETKDTLVVMVSGADVVVDGRRIATVPEAMASTDDLIAPLKAELEQQRANRQVVRKENAAEAQAITILGDKDIPYQLLRKVMFSCARAGYTDVRFAVRQVAES